MPWMLNLHPVSHPRAGDLLLLLGKITHLATAFESKCQAIRRIGHQVQAIQDAPDLSFDELVASIPKELQLAGTINAFPALGVASDKDIAVLDDARMARNALIHEGIRFSLHSAGAVNEKLIQHLGALRPKVRALAAGENLVSSWHFAIENGPGESMPVFFMDGYVDSVEQWVFASVWDVLKHPEGKTSPCLSKNGRVIENYDRLPTHLRPGNFRSTSTNTPWIS